MKKCVLVLEDNIIKQVSESGIQYYVLNTFEMEDLENKIIKMTENSLYLVQNKNDLKITVTNMLHELGVPSNIKGYEYIRESIMLLYDDSNMINKITKELYPEIAHRYNTSISKVERSIRHAIEISFNRGNLDLIEELFGHSINYHKSKPTNSEFIATIVDKLKLEYQLL